MARFYDAVNDADLKLVEDLLKKGGIEYTVREVGDTSALTKEILVAEEDLVAAEQLLCGKS